jgi:hypothetical protein
LNGIFYPFTDAIADLTGLGLSSAICRLPAGKLDVYRAASKAIGPASPDPKLIMVVYSKGCLTSSNCCFAPSDGAAHRSHHKYGGAANEAIAVNTMTSVALARRAPDPRM